MDWQWPRNAEALQVAYQSDIKHSSLSALPMELVIDILSALDFRSLLTCRRVCRLFHMLVHDCTALQYCIELAVAGMEDGPPSSVSAAERLNRLRQYKAAWDSLKWVRDETIDMSGHLWELYGGVLAQYDSVGQSLNFRQLPSDSRGIECQVWSVEILGTRLRDFAMDPSQDLLVLIENPKGTNWGISRDELRFSCIHFRNLRTGEAHPSARLATITHEQDTPDALVKYTLQVSGDHIGILFHHQGGNELLIVEWKTGQVKMRVFGDEIRSFAFLTDQHVMIAVLSAMGSHLLVMDFKHAPERPGRVSLEDVGNSQGVSSFYFPRLSYASTIIEITIRSDPAPSWTPHPNLQIPFFTARDSRLYVITIWVENHAQMLSVVLFVPSSTLISRLNDGRFGDHHPWEEWGPRGTRMIPSPGHSFVWVCYVFGTKFVVHRQLGTTPSIQVYDFNHLALQQALGSDNVPSNMTERVVWSSVVHNYGVFSTAVSTSLPYLTRTTPLQLESGDAVMCSEDSLIIVKGNDERQFRILTF